MSAKAASGTKHGFNGLKTKKSVLMKPYEKAINTRLNGLAGIDKPKGRNEFKKLVTMYEQKRIKQENAIKAYLTKEYGQNFFTNDDEKQMEIRENGDVHVGAAIIKTGIAIIKTGIAIE